MDVDIKNNMRKTHRAAESPYKKLIEKFKNIKKTGGYKKKFCYSNSKKTQHVSYSPYRIHKQINYRSSSRHK